MSWMRSIVVALLGAVVAAVASGFVADLAVGWYHVSSREGGAGAFVIGLGLLGFVGGFVVALVTSRVVARSPRPGLLRAAGLSQLVVLGLVAVIGVTARLLADVPPTIDGEELLLQVEFRWPPSRTTSPATDPGEWRLFLGSTSGGTLRRSARGPLWKEDAHQVDGRWVVPGAVELFTGRGARVIDAEPKGIMPTGFLVSVPAWPGRRDLAWSEWLPRRSTAAADVTGGFSYRWRLVKRSEPIRTQQVGAFEVQTIASGFDEVSVGDGPPMYEVNGSFALQRRGAPVVLEGRFAADAPPERITRVTEVATLPGAPDRLLVQAESAERGSACFLVTAEGSALRTELIAACSSLAGNPLLTADAAAFAAARARHSLRGRVDTLSFARPGLYYFGEATLDTRRFTIRRFAAAPADGISLDWGPPFALSPDERSFVRSGSTGDEARTHVLVVTDAATGETYTEPIDTVATRFAGADQLDPAWVAHYFEWRRGPSGADRLVRRNGVAPLPWHGRLSVESDGYREYRLRPASEALRDALVGFVVREFHGERQPGREGAYATEVRVDGKVVNVTWDDGDRHVGVFMDRGQDTRLVATVAERFDAALATGRYDALFPR